MTAPVTLDYMSRDYYSDVDYRAVELAVNRRKFESKQKLKKYMASHPADKIPDELVVKSRAERIGEQVGTCPTSWISGIDAVGHRYAKELYCGREWCPICGKKDSVAHLRRFESWLPKIQKCRKLGLFVIEFPLSSRNKPRSKKALESYGRLVKRVLSGEWELSGRRRRGDMLRRGEVAEIRAKWFDKGLRRWHFFGDTAKELSRLGISWQTDASESVFESKIKSNVHLNVIVDAGYLVKPWLRHIIATLRYAFDEPSLIVHYGYTKEPARMIHMLKYTTRATFLDYTWDKYLAGQLYGFRNMRYWGKWAGDDEWSLPDGGLSDKEANNLLKRRSLGNSLCPIDGLPIKWSRPRYITELREIKGKRKLGSGYYVLPTIKPPMLPIAETRLGYWRRITTKALAEHKRRHSLDSYYASVPPAIQESMFPDIIESQLIGQSGKQ